MSAERLGRSGLDELRGNWRTLATTTLGVALGSAGAYYYSQGLFYLPVATAFGVPVARVSETALFAIVPAVVATVLYGRLLDRVGPRIPVIVGVLLFSAALTGMGLYHGPFVGFRVLQVIAAVCATAVNPVVYSRIVSGAFDRARGRALGITLGGIGVIGFVAPVPIAAMIAATSYREGYLLLALVGLVPLPLLLLLRRSVRTPVIDDTTSTPVAPVSFDREPHSWPVGRALRSAPFVAIVLTFMVGEFAVAGMQLDLSPILQSRGSTPVAAAATVSVVGIGVVAGRLVAGFLMDRVAVPNVALSMFLVTAAALTLLLVPTTEFAGVAAFFIGTAFGMEVDMMAYLVGRLFGLVSFGTLYATAFTAVSVCLVVGPLLGNLVYDRTGSYAGAIVGAIVALVLAAVGTRAIPRTRALLPLPESTATGGVVAGNDTARGVES